MYVIFVSESAKQFIKKARLKAGLKRIYIYFLMVKCQPRQHQ